MQCPAFQPCSENSPVHTMDQVQACRGSAQKALTTCILLLQIEVKVTGHKATQHDQLYHNSAHLKSDWALINTEKTDSINPEFEGNPTRN